MKHIIRKILKEQEEIINVPDLDFFDNDWEELLRFTKGRKFRVRGGLDLREFCPETLGNMISVDGYLNLIGCNNLTSLGSLERVDGNLYLSFCENLTSLGSLERVGGKLTLIFCKNLTSLGSLEYVDKYLNLFNCKNLTSLGSLKRVGGYLELRGTPIAEKYSEREIREIIEVDGVIFI
jgi:hypothetical protein